eukprot:1175862-Prorocentrum_minimum.AAC.2
MALMIKVELEEFRAKRAASQLQIKKRSAQATPRSDTDPATTSETPYALKSDSTAVEDSAPDTSKASSITPERGGTSPSPSNGQSIGGGMPDEDPGDAMVTVLMHQV